VKDSDVRGLVLETFYNARHKIEWIGFNALMSHIALSVDTTVIANVCDQLRQHALIEWRPLGNDGVRREAFGKITARGIDVIEGTATPPISISINDHSIRISGSTQVAIGDRNVQSVQIDIATLSAAIDSLSVDVADKEKTKTLLAEFAANPTIWSVFRSALSSVFGVPK
jgi:hypothetical protein